MLSEEEEATLGQVNSAESGQLRLDAGLNEISEQLKAENQAYLTSALTDLSSVNSEIAEIAARIHCTPSELSVLLLNHLLMASLTV